MEFNNLDLDSTFKKNLKDLGFLSMTSIQQKALPLILDKKDLIARANTGSGKTLAFCLPIVKSLKVEDFKIQALILAPTRELANQIANELRALARHIPNVKVLSLTGGVPYKPQVHSLSYGANIVVATPGRVLKHIKEKNINFDDIKTLVLDEADKMLDMGFYEDINHIIESLPKQRQTLLFSATYEENIQELSKNILSNPVFVENKDEKKVKINQIFYKANESARISLIPALIRFYKAKSILIFSNMKIKCEELADDLYEQGLDVLTLHSDIEQKQRDEILTLFSNKSYPILIATDVASRGLDVDDIDLVINYDLAKDEKTHTHRIGRTARAGKGGIAVSFWEDYDEEKIEDLKEIFDDMKFCKIEDIKDDEDFKIDSPYRTIYINGGKKQKLRAGDILGALTAGIGLDKNDVGKINSQNFCTYVAIKKEKLDRVLKTLPNTKIKGKYFKIYEK